MSALDRQQALEDLKRRIADLEAKVHGKDPDGNPDSDKAHLPPEKFAEHVADETRHELDHKYDPGKPVQDIHGLKVERVDGAQVQRDIRPDFAEGDNDMHAKQENEEGQTVPDKTVQVDGGIADPERQKHILEHEIVERQAMLHKGLPYEKAHQIALKLEQKRARENPPATPPGTKPMASPDKKDRLDAEKENVKSRLEKFKRNG